MITLDGINIQEFGIRPVMEHTHPITPEYERKTITIPGRPGSWDFGGEIREKPFTIPVKVIENSMPNLQRKLNDFVSYLTDDRGLPREVKLVFDYEIDKHYTVKLNGMLSPNRLGVLSDFEIPFIASDPFKYSNLYADEVTWGSEVITFEYNYLLGREGLGGTVEITSPQTLDIPVDGLAVQPIFEIEGTANNLEISANGYSFGLPNFSNDTWKIDFEKYLVYRNEQETMIEIREFYLLPGNNEVKISGNNIDVNMRIKYRDRFS